MDTVVWTHYRMNDYVGPGIYATLRGRTYAACGRRTHMGTFQGAAFTVAWCRPSSTSGAGSRKGMGAMSANGYQSLQVSPDGTDYITDHWGATPDDVWEAVNDQGSRWFFYPIAFVVTSDGNGYQSGAATLRKRIISAPEPFQHLEGLSVATAMREIANDPDYVASILS